MDAVVAADLTGLANRFVALLRVESASASSRGCVGASSMLAFALPEIAEWFSISPLRRGIPDERVDLRLAGLALSVVSGDVS